MSDTDTRLPRGRHGLSPDEVATIQRRRLMVAMADAVAAEGYVGTSVASVLERAGVSRVTFYQQFTSKLDCFLETFDGAGRVLLADLTRLRSELAAADLSPIEQFDRLLGRYLDTLAENLPYARVLLVEGFAAGPEAVARRTALQARLVDEAMVVLGVEGDRGRFACAVLVAAVGSMVIEPIMAGDPDALRALHAPVLDLVRSGLAR